MTLLQHHPDPQGVLRPQHEVFDDAVEEAELVEQLGLDAYGVGERHAQDFLASSPTVTLAAIAARTSRIRLLTTVTVLPLLDPVRVAEDYATLHQLSHGRLEPIVGKGNDPRQLEYFGIDIADQWRLNREKYALLHRLWGDEPVSWDGGPDAWRPPLTDVITTPRPYLGHRPRVWHGSASSTESTELAAEYGDPLFSANAFHRMEKYAVLVDHYRERYAAHGHDPARAWVGLGSGAFYVGRTSQDAVERLRPFFENVMRTFAASHNRPEWTTIEEAIEIGPYFIGSRQQVLDKIAAYYERIRHDVFQVAVQGFGLPKADRVASLERFALDVAPELRRLYPSAVWEEEPVTAPQSLPR